MKVVAVEAQEKKTDPVQLINLKRIEDRITDLTKDLKKCLVFFRRPLVKKAKIEALTQLKLKLNSFESIVQLQEFRKSNKIMDQGFFKSETTKMLNEIEASFAKKS